MASIYSIVYHPKDQEYQDREGDFIRHPLQTAQLIADHGIEGDQKAGHQPDRQLNLISLEWLAAVKPRGYRTEPGQFGEQIIIEGLAVQELAPGDRLQIGNQALIEVTKLRNGCERLEKAQGKSREGLGPLGAMAKVITGGAIKLGDTVTVLETASSD
jgi:MOSC domain-containing protein YiiM